MVISWQNLRSNCVFVWWVEKFESKSSSRKVRRSSFSAKISLGAPNFSRKVRWVVQKLHEKFVLKRKNISNMSKFWCTGESLNALCQTLSKALPNSKWLEIELLVWRTTPHQMGDTSATAYPATAFLVDAASHSRTGEGMKPWPSPCCYCNDFSFSFLHEHDMWAYVWMPKGDLL